MPSYTQLYVQLVFVVKWRQCLIAEEFRLDVQEHMKGVVERYKSKCLAVYCNPDHTHILVSLNPTVAVSHMARALKANASKWINENRLTAKRFVWQRGYGAFSYSKSSLGNLIRYINRQAEHHRKKTFKEEYLALLDQYSLPANPDDLFDWPE